MSRQTSFFKFPDLPVDTSLFVMQFMENREKGRGFGRSQAGFTYDETLQMLHKILRRELSFGQLGHELYVTEYPKQDEQGQYFFFSFGFMSMN